MKLYSDIGKTAKKLLSDDYIFTNKVKLSSKTDDGATYTISGVQSPKDGAIDAEFNGKLKIKEATVTTKLFTSSKEPTVELKYETKDSQDRKVTLAGLASRSTKTASVEFISGPVGIKAGTDLLKSDLYGSMAVAITPSKFAGFAVAGAEAEYNITSKETSTANFGFSYFDGKESEYSIHVLDKAQKGMISYSHHVRPGFSVGAQITYVKDTKETNLSMGTAYRMDGATTVKTKIDSKGSLGLSYIQDIRPNTTLIMSSMFDTTKLDSAKVGISLTVE